MFMLSSHLWIRTHSAFPLDLFELWSFIISFTSHSSDCWPNTVLQVFSCLSEGCPSLLPTWALPQSEAVATDPHRALLCGLTLETGFNRLLLALSEGRTAQAASLWLNTTKRERKQLELASRSRDLRGEDGWRPSHQSPGRPLREH